MFNYLEQTDVNYIRGNLIVKAAINPIPDISRVRGVHLQDIQGCSRSKLLQALDNAANGRLAHVRRVKIFHEIFGLVKTIVRRLLGDDHIMDMAFTHTCCADH